MCFVAVLSQCTFLGEWVFSTENKLEADWKQTGRRQEGDWKKTGSRLEADWKQTENRLEADFTQAGPKVDSKWINCINFENSQC